jgi:DNA polymerase-1
VPDKGDWYEADHDTCEIRICNHYAKAKVWTEGFQNGVDPHTSVADRLGINRRYAKTINLGLMTGMGKRALAEDLGVPFEEGRDIVNQYFAGLPELKDFQSASKSQFQRRGFVRTLVGRRCRLESSRFAYKALNRLTQGGNADVIKANMVECDQVANHYGAQLLLSVHDSLSWQTENPKASEAIKKAMENTTTGFIRMSTPLSVTVGHGKTWAEATYFDE